VPRLRAIIDRHTFTFTDSELERWFLPIARRAGYPKAQTQVWFPGIGHADFWFPELGIVVETDGGLYHRTPMQQTKDRRRDQAHLVAGRLPLRFTHGQIRYAPAEVEGVLVSAAATFRVAAA
jgi:very-short-patch-repair endonuclease